MTEKQSENDDFTDKINELRLSDHGLETPGTSIVKFDRELKNGPGDVMFIVDGERLPAHRLFLKDKNPYFNALLYGGLAETQLLEIPINAPLKPFELILNYLYSGFIAIDSLSNDEIVELLDLANMYGIENLLLIIMNHFCQIISVDNVLQILYRTSPYNLDALQIACFKYIDRNGMDILRNENFIFLPQELIEVIISRPSFYASEIEIFSAILNWSKANPTIDVKPLLTHVRFSIMDESDLINIVLASSILTPNELQEYKEKQSTYNYLPYRGLRIYDKLAVTPCNSIITHNLEKDFDDDDEINNLITVDLGNVYVINSITMSLYAATPYYIEISVNGKDWKRIIDYMNCLCQSLQELYFPVSPVALLRISNGSGNINFCGGEKYPLHVDNLTLLYTKEAPEMINGYIKPVKDIIRRFRHTLQSGTLKQMRCPVFVNSLPLNYVAERLTYPITVQLNQPYIIDKMGICILDYEMNPSSFYCESSLDSKRWTMLLDKRRSNLVDRHCFDFEPRPIVFIRFFGTHNPFNNSPDFCISKLECPPNDPTMFMR